MMTYIIIAVTAVVSILILQTNREKFIARFGMRPYEVMHRHQWWRIITHGFVHSDYIHLIVNMITLFSFGRYIEHIFRMPLATGIAGSGAAAFLLLYFGGMIVASLYDLIRHRNNMYYNTIGASGAVSAVIFASVFFAPWNMIYFFGIIPMPGLLFGALYLYYEWYSARNRRDGINHFAHIFGALYGFVFPLLLNPSLWQIFIYNVQHFKL